MLYRPKSTIKGVSPPVASFKQRYDEMERHRAGLIKRLSGLRGTSRNHPAYKRALKLANEVFRKSSLAKRYAVLQAATWLTDILERL